MTLHVTYYHRQKDPAKASQKPRRGLFPALMLLGISSGLTPLVRQRMAKASAETREPYVSHEVDQHKFLEWVIAEERIASDRETRELEIARRIGRQVGRRHANAH